MHIHKAAFWGIVFFLVGVFLAPSVKLIGIVIVTMIAMIVLGSVAYRTKSRRMQFAVFLAGLMFVGAIYCNSYNTQQRNKTAGLIGKHIEATAHVIDVRQTGKVQQIKITLDEPNIGTIAVTARGAPMMEYGDVVRIEGIVKRPNKVSMQYLAKDAIFASMDFPNIEIKKHNGGNSIKQYLFGIRRRIVATYESILAPDEAALLAGITIGERANFDKEFVQQMKQSGTTHLVALSGYNISIIAIAVVSMLGWGINGGLKFLAAFGVITLFVVMAGAEASAVRAAIMGSIVLLAQYIGRAHSMRNAIAVSALLMVLWNPNVLRYDLGFQLSFMALIGIVYVKPHTDTWLKRGKEGILEWRENLSGTTAAQLAVFPILMNQIGSFSMMAVFSNIAVLAFIPMTMFFGFLIGALGFISPWLASIPAPIVSVLLHYEIGVIRLFGAHAGLTTEMNAMSVVIYYIAGGTAILYLQKRLAVIHRSA